ncbi:RidA family protein [Streptomyces sp. NBC_01718]|uniref:RidA family protein n=1 Tax=Streptomyces sp. NBC_01718 TaxID=2975919 RepID=UPI00352D80B2
MDGNGDLVGKGDAEAQVRQVYANLIAALKAAGSDLEHLAGWVYLTDLNDLGAFRKVRDEYQEAASPPACSLVRVAGLVHPDFRVEVERPARTCQRWRARWRAVRPAFTVRAWTSARRSRGTGCHPRPAEKSSRANRKSQRRCAASTDVGALDEELNARGVQRRPCPTAG